MTKLEETLATLRNDIQPPTSKEEFLAFCVKLRLEEQTAKYDQDFDKFLHNLEINENYTDFDKMSNLLLTTTTTINNVYISLIKEIQKLEVILL